MFYKFSRFAQAAPRTCLALTLAGWTAPSVMDLLTGTRQPTSNHPAAIEMVAPVVAPHVQLLSKQPSMTKAPPVNAGSPAVAPMRSTPRPPTGRVSAAGL